MPDIVPSFGSSLRTMAAGVAQRVGPRPEAREVGAIGKGLTGWGNSTRARTETQWRLMGASAWADQVQQVLWDPKLRAAWGLRLSRMLSADFMAIPSEKGEGAQEIAAYINENYGWEGRPGKLKRAAFKTQAAERMQGFLGGWSLADDVMRIEDGVVWLSHWSPRHIGNLIGWEFDEFGVPRKVEMRNAMTGGNYKMDLDGARKGAFHLSFSFNGDPEGRDAALARPIFSWLEMKQHAAKQIWTGLGRWANPVPVARVNYMAGLRERIRENFIAKAAATALETAKAFYSGESSAMADSDLVTIEKFGGDLDVSAPVSVVNLIDHQALSVMDAAFMVMGVSTPFGSNSASETHGTLGVVAASNMLDHFCSSMEMQTVRRQVGWQFGRKAPVPMIRHKGLDADGLGNIIGGLPHLIASQVLTADPTLEDHVRRTYGMPVLEEMRDAAERLRQGSDDSVGNPGEPGPGRGNTAAQVVDMQAFAEQLSREMAPQLVKALAEREAKAA